MANTTVTKVSEMMLTNVTAGVKAGEKGSDATGFSQVMDNAKDTAGKVQNMTRAADDTKSSRTVVEKSAGKEIKSEEPVRKDPVNNKDDKDLLVGKVAEETSKIMNKIKEVLGVSDEELTEAMETLGITAVDLLNPISVKDLCMELTGTPDSISLLTNAEVYENIKEIVQTAEDAATNIAAEFDTTSKGAAELFKDESFADAVKEAVTSLSNRSEAENLQTEAVPATEGKIEDQLPNIQDTDVEKRADEVITADNKDNVPQTVTDEKAVTVEVKGMPEAKPAEDPRAAAAEPDDTLARVNQGTTETFKATVKSEESNLKGNNEGFEHASRFAQNESIGAPQQTVETTVNNLGDVIETVTTYSNADADSIMNQVTQSIRVNYLPDMTSMEMQLHPASLGTVNMQIASTNGVVTAHIIVESEAVKAALESQLITLQQTFDEQGTKVEAVEVTVANYDLNRGGSSDTESNSQDRSEGRTGRIGGRRRINLNDLDDEEFEELSDDEKIAADMMARSGNSVDYTA